MRATPTHTTHTRTRRRARVRVCVWVGGRAEVSVGGRVQVDAPWGALGSGVPLLLAHTTVGLYTILPSPILYGVWHAHGGSVSAEGRILRNGRAIVSQ